MSQRHVHSPTQRYNLLKSFVIVFAIQAAFVLLSPIPLLDPWRFLILALNLVITIVLGWRLYKYRYHIVFTYDNEIFTLKKGKGEEVEHKWSDFSRVSVFRTEYGELAVRLYFDKEFFDVPASKLKLNPFDFRGEVMGLISTSKN